MNLKDWLVANEKTNAEFGKMIERTAEAVRRYANGERIPDRDTMPSIVAATGGEVQPNDFFGMDGSATSESAAA